MKSLNGREMLNIIDYDTPEPEFEDEVCNYIVLESISSNTSKVIHVVNMDQITKLYIGRGHDAHVRVTDISVSRVHAILIKSTQGYYML
jgi:pSer/pThr/pTyr-binding forkhead associated (FHA) protein